MELSIISGSLNSDEAALLQAPAGYTCVEIQRISYNTAGELMEFDIERWRHDALQLKVALG